MAAEPSARHPVDGQDAPLLSIVIPVLNAARDLPACLDSVRRQSVPRQRLDLVVVDGGSVDGTRRIAVEAGARVVDNPHRKAEPGVALGMRAARAPVVTVMAADNRMQGTHFAERIVEPFQDPEVIAVFPRVVSTADDGPTVRYVNRYSDPFNHFVYGTEGTSVDVMLRREHGEARQSRAIKATITGHPLLAVAQGCTVRAGSVYSGSPELADDVVAVIQLLQSGGTLVLLGDVRIEHHHVAGLASLFKKYRNRSHEALNSKQGYLQRQRYLTRRRRLRTFCWAPYSATLLPAVLHSLAMAARYRDPLLLYHPIINSVLFAAVLNGLAAGYLERLRRE